MEPQQNQTSSNNSNGSKNGNGNKAPISLANLITILVLLAGAFLAWQNMRDKIDFQAVELQELRDWKTVQEAYTTNARERLISLEGRVNAYDAAGCRPLITNRR